jgi:hypothetical protein
LTAPDSPTIDLIPLCTARIAIRRRLDAGAGANGHNMIGEIDSAVFSGRIDGTHAGDTSADWVTILPSGLRLAEVRLAIRTRDEALLMMRYSGPFRREPGEASPVFVAASFQTGDPRYQWLAEVQVVGKGRPHADGTAIDYAFYELG